MRRYLPLLLALMLWLPSAAQQAAWQKLSPMLRQLVRQPSAAPFASRSAMPSGSRSQTSATPREVCALIRLRGDVESVLSDYGSRSLGAVADIHIVSIPVDRLGALSLDPRVVRIEARPVCQPLLDTVSVIVDAAAVHDGLLLPQAFKGEGVTVGVMDIGFDLTHPAFYSRDLSRYRIRQFWDMLSTDTVGSTFYVGRDYATPEAVLAQGRSYDAHEQYHGTHTAGIAAGSGYLSAYRGLAPESDICLVANAVSSNANLIDSTLYSRFTFATDVLGFKYLFESARRAGQPCVVSFSEGSPQDFWGYDQLYYEMLDSLLGPGCIMVSSAGNEGYLKSWFRHEPSADSEGMFVTNDNSPMLLTVKSAADFQLRLVHYGASNDTLLLRMSDVLAADDSLLVIHTSPTDSVAVQAYPNCYDAAETCYDVELYSTSETIGTETPLSFEVLGNTAAVECWRYNGDWTTNGLNPRLAAGETTHNVLSPSSAPRVICVGATTYRDGVTNRLGHWQSYWGGEHGRRAPYSSMGPTMDGRTKPDVVAPGNYVVSAVSSYFMEGREPEFGAMKWIVSDFDFQGRTYGWCAAMGTSQSGPVVAGIIALWLQANPTLTPEDVMGVIRRTSHQPDPSLPSPNNAYGYGEIDAYRGLLDVLGMDAIEGLSVNHTTATVRCLGDQLSIELPASQQVPLRLRIFSMDGRQQLHTTLDAGRTSYLVNIGMLPAGIYAVQLDGPSAVKGSTLIRR